MIKRIVIKPGDKFNNLTIVSFSHSDKRNRKWFNVVCICGTEKKIMGSAMVSGNTKSCGCLTSKYMKEHHLLPDSLGTKRQIILQYKRHAKSRNIDFNINEHDFINLLTKPCFYCGQLPDNIKRTKNDKEGFIYSGIDRVDSNLGYTANNCVPCCKICNFSKSNMSIYEFQKWAVRIGSMANQWSNI